MDYIEIKGYKSIKEAKIELKPINILIGANGAGKTNFISFFEFINRLYDQKLQHYVAIRGGMEKMLHNGSKVTNTIEARIAFDQNKSGYSFIIEQSQVRSFVFINETLWDNDTPNDISEMGLESKLIYSDVMRNTDIRKQLSSLKKYHFDDTGEQTPFYQQSNIKSGIHFLYEDGRNLAAMLYHIRDNDPKAYVWILKTIKNIAPYFSDFYFEPNSHDTIPLQWKSIYSSVIYDAPGLSSGTLRFIALALLFMQPKLPATIIIDEPELGLHPFAIAKLAGMIQSAADNNTQVIIATQSTELINHFKPEDIITVDQQNGESTFNRLDEKSLSVWLEDYSLGELWKRNIIETGQP